MTTNRYPRTFDVDGKSYVIRKVTDNDETLLHAFATALPAHDLLYLRRDISQRPVIDAWVAQAAAGEMETLVIEFDGRVVGTSALIIDTKSWSRHVGEIRVLVAIDQRKSGLGRMLIEETFMLALERDLKKIIAQMTIDQKGAMALFEESGFSGEALLKDHVQDTAGTFHDILILSCDVDAVLARTAMSR